MSSNNDDSNTSTSSHSSSDRIVLGYLLLSLSLICLGTWPALLRLASTGPPRRKRQNLRHDDDDIAIDAGTSTGTDLGTTNQPRRRRRMQPVVRDARFVYLDYAFSYVVSSCIPLVLGMCLMRLSSSSSNDTDTEDSNEETVTSSTLGVSNHVLLLVLFAMAGGGLLSIGNLSLQWATTVYMAPLTTVVAIQASLTVTVGTTMNYMLQPERTAHVLWLGTGVVLFLLAITAAAAAHLTYGPSRKEHKEEKRRRRQRQLQQQLHERPDTSRDDNTKMEIFQDEVLDDDSNNTGSDDEVDDYSVGDNVAGFYMPASPGIELKETNRNVSYNSLESFAKDGIDTNTVVGSERNPVPCYHRQNNSDPNDDDIDIDKAPDGSLALSRRIHRSRVAADRKALTSTQTALLLAIGGGCCFGFFSPAFNVAVNDPFDFNPSSNSGLSVAVANLWFSLAFTVVSVIGTIVFMHAPPIHSGLIPTTWNDYTKAPLCPDRFWAIIAGCMCGMANLLQFQGGQLVGFATADLVQAFPLVSTLWDIFLFGEYRRPLKKNRALPVEDIPPASSSSSSTSLFSRYQLVTAYLVAMYVLYLGAIVCMMASSAAV